MFSRIFPLIALLVGAGIAPFFASAGAPKDDEPGQNWNSYYFLASGPESRILEILQKQNASSSTFRAEDGTAARRIFRIQIEHLREFESDKEIRILEEPPFRLVDPDISSRRQNAVEFWRGYKDEVVVEKIAADLAAKYPSICRDIIIGRTIEGRAIHALKISDNPEDDEDEPGVLFNAAHHGNEVLSVEYALDTARFLLENYGNGNGDTADIVNEFETWVVPLVNPDGLHHFWNDSWKAGRKNARDTILPRGWNQGDGIDLNRNYPFRWNSGFVLASSSRPWQYFYRGPHPGSEPETRAMMDLARKKRFAMSISFHTNACRILVPYTADATGSPFPDAVWRAGRLLAQAGQSHRTDRNYEAVRNLYPVDGTDQDWLHHSFGSLSFIAEGSYQSPPFEIAERSIQGMRPIALKLYDIYRDGPTLSVLVTDEENRPLEAEVRILEYAYLENERFLTKPSTGSFDFFLEDGGEFTVQARRQEYQDARAKTLCQRGICRVHLILTR